MYSFFFFFNDTATTEIYTLSLHDALPICAYSMLLQNEDGQIRETHSVSAGLDYPGVGPEHALLAAIGRVRSEEHTSELQSRLHLVCRLLLEKKKTKEKHFRSK